MQCLLFVWLDYNSINRFLNRILGIEVELQNKLFRFFTDTLTSIILDQKRRGAWDMGILGTAAAHILHTLHVCCCLVTPGLAKSPMGRKVWLGRVP